VFSSRFRVVGNRTFGKLRGVIFKLNWCCDVVDVVLNERDSERYNCHALESQESLWN